jgi:hypothetical protein
MWSKAPSEWDSADAEPRAEGVEVEEAEDTDIEGGGIEKRVVPEEMMEDQEVGDVGRGMGEKREFRREGLGGRSVSVDWGGTSEEQNRADPAWSRTARRAVEDPAIKGTVLGSERRGGEDVVVDVEAMGDVGVGWRREGSGDGVTCAFSAPSYARSSR